MAEINFQDEFRDLAVGMLADSLSMETLIDEVVAGKLDRDKFDEKLSDLGRCYGLSSFYDTQAAFVAAINRKAIPQDENQC